MKKNAQKNIIAFVTTVGFTIAVITGCSRFSSEAPIREIPGVTGTEELKVVSRLERFLSLGYSSKEIRTAYNEYFSSKYKARLAATRGISNAESYVRSNPYIDFEFVTSIETVKEVRIEGNTARVEALTIVYDLNEKKNDIEKQVFLLEKENGKWVCSF
ncbi:MAG: hypothetical protein HZC28_02010 [Spirochaetes bacterium]|nr:hypothetical protein [Spirochaetota bacterium]